MGHLVAQQFVDWPLWAKVSPVAALQHIRSLLKKVKTYSNIYRGHLTVSRLLTAAGFYFAPRKTICDVFKSVLPLLPAEKRDSTEVALLEATNILMKYIRQGLYSTIRALATKHTTLSDMKSLFCFLESPAHPDVVSVTSNTVYLNNIGYLT